VLSAVDLFAGVGGLSLGAVRAGFDLRGAIEKDPIAIETHRINFPRSVHLREDVSLLRGDALLSDIGWDRGKSLDGLIGGPPCQGFSTIGRQGSEDSRNLLFHHFFRLVAEIRPRFFLAENVPGIMAPKFDHIRARALAQVPQSYVLFPPFKVRASDFGAATIRTRVFFLGIDSASAEIPKSMSFRNLGSTSPSVRQALSGLPSIKKNWLNEEQTWQKVGELPAGPFFERVSGHIPMGIGSAAALARLRIDRKVSGCLATAHAAGTIERFATLAQGEVDSVYRSKRLEPGGLCPTLRAGTGPERGSFQAVRPIHPYSPRVITTREAARLQGFPDWFQFHRTKWHSFQQIGNSISPLVAEAVLTAISEVLHS
jgi:DNA (cytosine-5)-methyltransferase 1